MNQSQTVEHLVRVGDHLRWGGLTKKRRRGFKEWMHQCIYTKDADVLVNLSLVDDVRPNASATRDPIGRTTVLFRQRGSDEWHGTVVVAVGSQIHVGRERLNLDLGASRIWYVPGEGYRLVANLSEFGFSLDILLEPQTVPSIINNVDTGGGPPINWLVVPRLAASGRLCLRGNRTQVDRAPAYHDHNWGHFSWGNDFAWEWGYGLPFEPSNPWSLVFVRLSDRRHHRVRMQGLFLWKGRHEHRVFRARDMYVRQEGVARSRSLRKVPAVMGLLHPDHATDVPERLHVECSAGKDSLDMLFESRSISQVIIPNDSDPGVTIINEVSGELIVDGRVGNESVKLRAPAVFEFLGA